MSINSSNNCFTTGLQGQTIGRGQEETELASTAAKASKLVLGFSIYQMQHIAEFFSLNDVLKLKSISVFFSKERNNINLLNFSLNYIEFIETSSKIEFSTLLGLLDRENIKSGINKIDLGNCFEIGDDDLMVMPNYFPRLRSVLLHRCMNVTNAGLKHLVSNYPDLQKVDLSRCYGIRDINAALKDLAGGCPKLRSISMPGIFVVNSRLRDADLKYLASNCQELESINLDLCAVTDAGIKELASNCSKLEFVALGSCKITDAGLKDLASNCQKLSYVLLSNCQQITDAGLKDLALNCSELHHIGLSYCKNVTVIGLKDLLSNCRRLRSINIKKCFADDLSRSEVLDELKGLYPNVFLDN